MPPLVSKSENLCPRSSACCLIIVIFCLDHHVRVFPSIFSTPFCTVAPVSAVAWGSAGAGADDDAPVSAGGGFGGRPFGLGSALGVGAEELDAPVSGGGFDLGRPLALGAEELDAPVSAGGSWTAFIGNDVGGNAACCFGLALALLAGRCESSVSALFFPCPVILRCASR